MNPPSEPALLQEILWGANIGAALWPFQPRGVEYLRPLHLHSQPELFVMRRGSVVLRIGGELYPMERGQAAWIPPAVQHGVMDFSAGADFWVLQPGPALLQLALAGRQAQAGSSGSASCYGGREQPGLPWLAGLGRFLPDPPVFVPKRADLSAFTAQAELTWSAYLDAQREPVPNPRFAWIPAWGQSRARIARALLLELVCQAFRMTPDTEAAQARLARRAFNLILQEPQLSREQLCERLAISESHLSRRFPAIFGASLVEQRARTRLVAFLALTRPPGVNLLHASLEAGFGSYAQLHRVLTRHSGCGPREYLSGGGDLRVASITCSRLRA